jgi:hypothetical protein
MTLLTAKFGLEKAFGAFRMTFTASKLPSRGTLNTLIPSRTTARITAQITFNATPTIAVIAGNDNENVNVEEGNELFLLSDE